jgi:hypothetical protein
MIGLLELAAGHGCEAALGDELAELLDAGELPDIDALRRRVQPSLATPPAIDVPIPSLASYDALLTAAGCRATQAEPIP